VDDIQYKDKDYVSYIEQLLAYLVSFMQRSQPLFDLDKFLRDIEIEFERKWALGEFTSWQPKTEDVEMKDVPDGTNNDKKAGEKDGDADQMETTSAEDKKSPLYCAACKKLFAKDTVFTAHLKGKKHLKRAETVKKATERDAAKNTYKSEMKIQQIGAKLLIEQIENSKNCIEKKQARSWDEVEEEEEEVEEQEESEEEEDVSEIKTTIENYPVGWDGKPIPYWLYKLHGLGVEYKCQICGDASYWGRQAYEKHFQERRHAYGMRCLGVPNTKQFHDITIIDDAVALWEKIKKEEHTLTWRPEAEEEFEDSEGNVFNRRTYEDLKRQGLL